MRLNECLVTIQIVTSILLSKFELTTSVDVRTFDSMLKERILPECSSQFDKRKCYLRPHENMTWEKAHDFCRTNGGFLPDENDLRQNYFPEEKIWTALTTSVEGFLQWVSRNPVISNNKEIWKLRSSCLFYNVREKKFIHVHCKAHFPFVCVVDITLEATLQYNITMQITANYQDQSKWIELHNEDFSKLKLTCGAYDFNTKKDVGYLKFIWKKDNAYIGWDSTTIKPTYFEPSFQNEIGNETSYENIPLKQQGTYCCEAWEPYSTAMVKHDCFLVTLKEITTFAKSIEIVPSLDGHNGTKLNDNIKSPQCELAQKSLKIFSPIDQKTFITDYELKLNIYVRGLPTNDIITFIKTCNNMQGITFKFVTKCYAKNHALKYGNNIQLPSSRAGSFYESDFKCEKENNTLAFQHCQWNSIDGAELSPSNNVYEKLCQRLDICPKPFTVIAETMCVQIIKNVTWEEGFVLLYQTGNEKTLFDDRTFHDPINKSSLTNLFEYLLDEEVHDVWLPLKRKYPFTPLINIGIGSLNNSVSLLPTREYPYTKFNWTELHPIGSKMCVVHNINNRTSYSDDCHMRYNIVRILDIPTKRQLSTIANNSTKLCEEGWHRVVLKAKKQVCIKTFHDKKLFSWEKAEEFCISQSAHLVNPTRGFMDWIIRSYLTENETSWINIRKFMISSEYQFEFINWLPETNFNKEYGIMSNKGWTMVDEPIERPHIAICEKSIKEHARLKLLIKEVENKYSETNYNTICVIIKPRKLLRPNSIKCLKNGEIVKLNCTNVPDCDCVFKMDEYGYYECTAWSIFPIEQVRSNIITKNSKFQSYVIIGTDNVELYVPFYYDSTFYNPKLSKLGSICLDNIQRFDNGHNIMNGPRVYYYSDNGGKFQYSFHLTCYFPNQSYCPSVEIMEDSFNSVLLEHGMTSDVCSVEKVKSTVGCRQVKQYFSDQLFEWLDTKGAGRFLPIELCILNDGLPMSRMCEGNYISGYRWLEPASVDCSKTTSEVSSKLWEFYSDPLKHLQEGKISLTNLTKNIKSLIAADFVYVELIFRAIVEDPKISRNITFEEAASIMNNMMETNLSTIAKAQDNFKSVSSLVNDFEISNFQTSLNATSKMAVKEKLSVSVIDISKTKSIVGHQFGKFSINKFISNENEIDEPNLEAAIVFPETFIQRIKHNLNNSVHLSNATQLQFITYKDTNFFNDSTCLECQINSDVIKASYNGADSAEDLLEYEFVTIYFRPKLNGESICVYYDFQKINGIGGWSEGGCEVIKTKKNLVVAKGNRLAHFALLFKNSSTNYAHSYALYIITIVGCSLSIIGLTMVLITFCVFQKFRKELRNKILASLALAILMSLALFLASKNANSVSITSCQALTIFLDYFILASFGWMFVEAIQNYLDFVKVIYNPISKSIQKASCCGWGMPIIPIAVALLISKGSLYQEEAGHDMCWLSYDVFIYTFVPIVVLITLLNTFIYVIIIHTVFLTTNNPNLTGNSHSKLLKAKIYMAVCVFVLLGLTWLFGFLTVGDGPIVFAYLFCIFNTAQGFLIFIFYIYKNKNNRKLWLNRFEIGMNLSRRWSRLLHVLHIQKKTERTGVNFYLNQSSVDESTI